MRSALKFAFKQTILSSDSIRGKKNIVSIDWACESKRWDDIERMEFVLVVTSGQQQMWDGVDSLHEEIEYHKCMLVGFVL